VNGRLAEAQLFAGYTNLARRFQYTTGLYQMPYYFGNGYALQPDSAGFQETYVVTRYIQRQAFGIGIYPLDRFTRFEAGMRLTNLERTDLVITRQLDPGMAALTDYSEQQRNSRTVNYVQPSLAVVSDNVLWGAVAPIYGRRYRLQVQPAVGNFQWTEYLADYRRYDPILFNYLTVATRVTASVSTGRDADSLRKYLGYSDILRGYDNNSFLATEQQCPSTTLDGLARCSPLLGSSVAVASAELRFPILRGANIGGVVPLPVIEGAVFYDAGTAWFGGQTLLLHRSAVSDPTRRRSLLTSHGFEIRVNLFNYLILRWDYAIPHDAPGRHGVWQFSLYPPF